MDSIPEIRTDKNEGIKKTKNYIAIKSGNPDGYKVKPDKMLSQLLLREY